ncbi:MAG: hypothetical protein LBF21_01385 [Puniceicoccales bacterium]|nr:hypothetical protein [Puniceicoccales bacterium]
MADSAWVRGSTTAAEASVGVPDIPATEGSPPVAEKRPDEPAGLRDETIIEAWMRALTQNALHGLRKNPWKTLSLLKSARGLLLLGPEKLGSLLGVHVGAALGFYRRSDGRWSLPAIYQVESKSPVKWGEVASLILPIEDEKAQVSLLLPQWPWAVAAEAAPDFGFPSEPAQGMEESPALWIFPESKDFPKKLELIFHFNREINEEFYGREGIRAVDIFFDDAAEPACLREWWSFLKKVLG